MDHVDKTVPIALTDASLQAWIHMTDGTQDIYYDKGSLAGLALDIMIRDAIRQRREPRRRPAVALRRRTTGTARASRRTTGGARCRARRRART